jgi:hypothetical protein
MANGGEIVVGLHLRAAHCARSSALARQQSPSPPRASGGGADAPVQDVVLPIVGGKGSVMHALREHLVDVQEGRIKWEGWGVSCACEEATVAGA